MNVGSLAVALALVASPLLAQQEERIVFEQNSDLATASLNGIDDPGGNVAIAQLHWLGETTSIGLSSSEPVPRRFLAVSYQPVKSLFDGAFLTPGGQIFSLDLEDPAFSVIDVSDWDPEVSFTFDTPLMVTMQLIVPTNQHPDGFALSAPIILNYAHAVGQSFTVDDIDATNLQGYEVSVLDWMQPTGPQELLSSEAVIPDMVKGSASLTTATGTQARVDLEVDSRSGALLRDGTPVSTLLDIFGVNFSVRDATLDLHFNVPLTLDVSGVQLRPGNVAVPKDVQPIDTAKTYVTDTGCEIVVSCDGREGIPDMTKEKFCEILTSLGLKDKVTIVEGTCPTDDYNCHGYTFICGAKWICNDQVEKILMQNGYKEKKGDDPVKVGHIAVYRDANGVQHTGRVTKAANGKATEVKGKWGPGSEVCHAPGDVPSYYGTPTYYCTTRCMGDKLKCKKTETTTTD